jgi:hypothetical protein
MTNLIERLKKILGVPLPSSHHTKPAVPLDDQTLDRLMHILSHTREDELSCEQVANCLDEYVDCISGRLAGDDLVPLIDHHLAMCPDCHEALDALVRAIEAVGTDE